MRRRSAAPPCARAGDRPSPGHRGGAAAHQYPARNPPFRAALKKRIWLVRFNYFRAPRFFPRVHSMFLQPSYGAKHGKENRTRQTVFRI
ncbi:hypothetical protein AZ19_4351 [Bordetella bronchiseptica E012]|uniref:Uncharacterized protein n=6 Tax=Bordetella TaxID=517 RepID=A0ABR4RI78_BORBO